MPDHGKHDLRLPLMPIVLISATWTADVKTSLVRCWRPLLYFTYVYKVFASWLRDWSYLYILAFLWLHTHSMCAGGRYTSNWALMRVHFLMQLAPCCYASTVRTASWFCWRGRVCPDGSARALSSSQMAFHKVRMYVYVLTVWEFKIWIVSHWKHSSGWELTWQNYTSQGSDRWDLSILLDVLTQARVIISNEKLQKLAQLNTLGLAGKMTASERCL